MSCSTEAVARVARKPIAGVSPRGDLQSEGERFTTLCSRDGRKRAAKKRRRSEEAFSAICLPGWTQA